MRALLFASFLGVILLLGACQATENSGEHVIRLGKAFSSPVELKASDYFSEIRYVPLETTDTGLVGSSPAIRLVDGYILVTTSQGQCLLFDKTTGRFRGQIGHVGDDPGGYKSVDCLFDDSNKRLIFKGWRNDLICYDLKGRFIGKIEIPAISGSYPENCFPLGGDTLIGYFQDMLGDEVHRMLYFKENGEQIALLPKERACPAFEIHSMTVWKGEEAVKEFGSSALRGVIYMEGQDPETATVAYPSNSCLWRTGANTYLRESFNDTIFIVDKTSLIPFLTFDCTGLAWEYKDRFRKDKSNGLFVSELLDGERFIFIQATTNMYDKEKRETYNATFDKKSGVTRVSPYAKGITDDINGFIPLQPLTVSSDGEYGGILTSEEILSWFDKHPEKRNSASLKALRAVKEEQNPIVVLMK